MYRFFQDFVKGNEAICCENKLTYTSLGSDFIIIGFTLTR